MNIKSIKLSISVFASWVYLFIFSTVNADLCQGSNCPAIIPNPLGNTSTLSGFVGLLLDTIFPIASLASVFLLIYAGFLMVMAGGNEEKLSKAKTALLWTIIGIAILLGAKVISMVVCGTIEQLGSPTLSC